MQTRVYKAGSIIYFAGDKADRVYILKQGQAQSIFVSAETGIEARELINIGEFFGVKSILGTYPQEETIQCLSDCSIIIIAYEEFEVLVSKNKPIIIKMLKVFSNQLRRINKKVRTLIENDDDNEGPTPLEGLFSTGEFYFKNKKFKHALYAYKKYLESANENSSFYNTVKSKIEECENAIEEEVENVSSINSNVGNAKHRNDNNENISYGEEATYNFDSVYSNAVSIFERGDYINALKSFNTLLKSVDKRVVEDSMFYMGKCYYYLSKYEDAFSVLLSSIQKYPHSRNVKEAILFLAKTSEQKGDLSKAKAYYQKVISISPMDVLSREANSNLSKLKG